MEVRCYSFGSALLLYQAVEAGEGEPGDGVRGVCGAYGGDHQGGAETHHQGVLVSGEGEREGVRRPVFEIS